MPNNSRSEERGFAVLVVLLVIVGFATLGVYTFINSTGFKKLTSYNRKLTLDLEEPNVVLAAEYENPLDDATQYQDPFADDSENPFNALEQ